MTIVTSKDIPRCQCTRKSPVSKGLDSDNEIGNASDTRLSEILILTAFCGIFEGRNNQLISRFEMRWQKLRSSHYFMRFSVC